ncbi:uncharacterized protein LOC122857589 isoform X2 [Aphidius gifuensis]|uniref:uncharacterized protein LOC122857589 isoform X2 n=1 Tax=Aphidius gifuensis TaxID=684658 RepID=UPI001CDC399F|nr:uncharacterized protein LOC122857589 isoform X2 [Aphidius gifuensis]
MNDKIIPRRKLSVFQRSFDINTVFETTQHDIITENHSLNDCFPIDNTTMNNSVSVSTANISHPERDDSCDIISPSTSEKTVFQASRFSYLFEKNRNKNNNDDNKRKNEGNVTCREQVTVENQCNDERDSKFRTLDKNDDIQRNKSRNKFKSIDKIPGFEVMKSSDGNLSEKNKLDVPEDQNGNNKTDNKMIEESSKMRRSMSIDEKTYRYNQKNKVISCCNCQSNRSQQENITLRNSITNEEFQVPNHELFQKSEIVNHISFDNTDIISLSEEELERKYLAFSIGVLTDKGTLFRRREISIRQRDQTENNLVSEIFQMQHDIQALALPCSDSETVEKIERARNRIAILLTCAQKVSCAAETVGAIQQECKLSHDVYQTDQYLKVLRSRCNKYAMNLAESKRILSENNIIIDENNGELSEELTPTLRYRGLPSSTNRTMDSVSQRDLLPGRIAMRRPSLTTQLYVVEPERKNPSESSDGVEEFLEIIKHAEPRRALHDNDYSVQSHISYRDKDIDETSLNTRTQQAVGTITNNKKPSTHNSRFRQPFLPLGSGSGCFFTWYLIILYILITYMAWIYMK